MQDFRRVAGLDADGLLGDDLAAVGNFIDEVHRSAGDLHAVAKGRLMHPETIEAFPAEGGNQAGMDVQNPLGVAGGELLGENGHKACQNDDLNAMLGQNFLEPFLKGCLRAAFLFQDNGGGNPCLFRPFQGIGPGVIGYHQGNFAALQHLALGIDQGLEIGAAAGDKNRNSGFHWRTTFSSPLTMTPMV